MEHRRALGRGPHRERIQCRGSSAADVPRTRRGNDGCEKLLAFARLACSSRGVTGRYRLAAIALMPRSLLLIPSRPLLVRIFLVARILELAHRRPQVQRAGLGFVAPDKLRLHLQRTTAVHLRRLPTTDASVSGQRERAVNKRNEF